MLEEKKPKSWLKSVSAFANGLGGSLFFGIDNEGILKGLDNVQYVCETISSKIRDYMDPLPDVEMIPHRIDNLDILQLKINTGSYTPYYYVGDGQRVAFVRVGEESLPATAEQMLRLVLKGSNKTYDSLLMLGHCLQMIVHCGNLVYIVLDGMGRQKAMPSMMLSLQEMC